MSFERVFVPDNITAENQNFSHTHSPVPMQLVQRSSQLNVDINTSFSSMDSETVSIPCPAESNTDLESAEPIAPSATLPRHDIIDMDRAAYKIRKQFKFGNNLMTIPKKKYIPVDDMINRPTSEN